MAKLKIYLVGHSHIDAVWLWEKEETKKVCKSTFKKVLDILDKRDDFYYCQSTAQFYEWMERESPEIFERIKQHIKNGKWEVVGGMWVESDTNLPSGESLVRQILYAKNYFKDKFNVDVKVGWLPDTFGYSWTLPQIFKKSGIDYFLTSKINWETTLTFPYTLFWWESPDGSKILSCATPGGYVNTNFDMVYKQLKVTMQKQPDLHSILIPYGEGDHGGGLTHEMINDALKGSSDSIKVFFSPSLKFFEDVKKECGDSLPFHNGELYLKTHRGTYTTRGRIKWLNRKGEVALDSTERVSTMAFILGKEYHQKDLTVAWKKLLFNQFHDDLPGSSINKVYDDAEGDFKAIFKITSKMNQESLKYISSRIDTTGRGDSLIAFNPLSWKRTNTIEVPYELFVDENFVILDLRNKPVPYQVMKIENKKYVLFVAKDIPSFGYKEYKIVNEKPETFKTDLKISNYSLENEFFKVEISPKTGAISNVYDKLNQREILDKNEPNMFYIYQDETPSESAWNIWIGKMERLSKPETIEVKEKGPIRASIETTYVYKQSDRENTIFKIKTILYREIPLIYFELYVDWHAKHRLTKVGFNIQGNAEFVTYEIPYGSISRRIPDSEKATPEERAKWEVSAQKWVDYTPENSNYGVSLLNDCKYGFDIKNGVLRMTLLRSAKVPDPSLMGLKDLSSTFSDQGEHVIKYALYPHKGDWKKALTFRKAYEFNEPLFYTMERAHTGKLSKEESFLSIKKENVIVSAVKRAEKSKLLVVRLYETNGENSVIQILSAFPLKEAWEADLLENPIKSIPLNGRNGFSVNVKKFEIKTLLLRPILKS